MFRINTTHFMGCRILTGCIVKTLHRQLSTIMGIDRTSSIENEPRTLTMDQIEYAREAALYVLNTRSIEEAMSIFTEGLEPLVSVSGKLGDSMLDISEEMRYLEEDDKMRLGGFRDIVSAPF